jgi:HEAT repeats
MREQPIMQKDFKHEEALSTEVQEIMRSIISAIRAVKLYPSNNPVYFNSVKKSFEALNNFLQTNEEYKIGIQKNLFSYNNIPFAKENEMNKPIAYDLFAKEIREIFFFNGLTETELLQFYQTLALTIDECKIKGGIPSVLWEKDLKHIKITEAGLGDVVTTPVTRGLGKKEHPEKYEKPIVKNATGFPGRTLVLADLSEDPATFSANMIELAKQTKAENETVEDRLFALYKEAGKKIDQEHSLERETLYNGLAKSVLALDPQYRNSFIVGKLYGELDVEIENEEANQSDEYLPGVVHEVKTGRFSETWTMTQMAMLLKKTAAKQIAVPSASEKPIYIEAVPLPDDLIEIAKNMAVYTEEDIEELQKLNNAGSEIDVMRSSTQTLIALIPLVKDPHHANPEENDIKFFSRVIRQIENALEYFLKKNDYDFTTRIIQALNLPVDTSFQPILNEVLKKAVSNSSISAAIGEVRKNPKDSSQYISAHSYLITFEQESTQVLLELLAEEQDRADRIFYLDLVKNIGKNQIALLGKHLSDVRWYFVRNIINIIGESKTDEAIMFLKRAVKHKDVRIRQEVIYALTNIGGKRAAVVLAGFLEDNDNEVKTMAIRAFASLIDILPADAKPLMDFLDKQPLKKKEQVFTLEAIKALGNIGDRDTDIFLKRYNHIRWWKSRKLQKELRVAAMQAREQISRRHG